MPARVRVVERHGGAFPASEEELRALPGIGDYTAAAIAAIAFDLPASPVDGNIERVVARLFAVEEPLPGAKPRLRQLARTITPQKRAGDFAQAMMDLGATICSPKRPACALCPWNDNCAAFARGDAETFPRRTPKREGALRRGAAFVVRRADGYLLVRTRPAKGLLGGMTEVPTTAWSADFDESEAVDERADFFTSLRRREGDRVAARCRRGAACVHAFPARAFSLRCRSFAAETPCAGRRALGEDFRAWRRSAAKPHAQSGRACARRVARMSGSDMRDAICGTSSLVEALIPDVACAHPGYGFKPSSYSTPISARTRARKASMTRQPLRRLHMPEGPAVAGFETLCQCADAVDRADRFAKRERPVGTHQRLMPLLGVDERDAWHHQPALDQRRRTAPAALRARS